MLRLNYACEEIQTGYPIILALSKRAGVNFLLGHRSVKCRILKSVVLEYLTELFYFLLFIRFIGIMKNKVVTERHVTALFSWRTRDSYIHKAKTYKSSSTQ